MTPTRIGADLERRRALRIQLADRRGVADVARQLVGLHASRQSGPYVTVGARLLSAWSCDLSAQFRSLILLRAMRGTLHAFDKSLAPVAHAAFRTQRTAAALATARRSGLSYAELETMRRKALVAIERGQGELAEAELLSVVPAPVARLLWAEGSIAAMDASGSPFFKRRHFVDTLSIEGWSSVDRGDAERLILRLYVATYGPVSLGDMIWWSGWGRKRTHRVFGELRHDLSAATLEGVSTDVWMLRDAALGEEHTIEEPQPRVDVVAYEDPSIKAYFETRERYLRGVSASAVFWHAGESLACVLVDGVVAGTWRHCGRPPWVTWTLLRPLSRDVERRVASRLLSTGAWLRQMYTHRMDSAYGGGETLRR